MLGAIMLASKGIFAKHLYSLDVDYETLAATRSVLAIPGFMLIALLSGSLGNGAQLRASHAASAIGAGLLCYYLGSLANFYALTLIDASVERALLFTYPAMITLITVSLGLAPVRISTIVALVTTFTGIALVVGISSDKILEANLEGTLWIFACAFTIAIYFLVSARLSQVMGSAMFTLLAMGAAGTAFGLHYSLRYGWLDLSLSAEAWFWMLALVLVATVIPLSLVAEGVRRIGSQRAAFASTIGPPATTVMAVIILGERLSPGQLLGIFVIVGSILYLELTDRSRLSPS